MVVKPTQTVTNKRMEDGSGTVPPEPLEGAAGTAESSGGIFIACSPERWLLPSRS